MSLESYQYFYISVNVAAILENGGYRRAGTLVQHMLYTTLYAF